MKMSHVVLLLLLAALLFITPLVSSSLRQAYLYFIMNLLIVALGAEAGLLKPFSNPIEDHHQDKKATPTHAIDEETHGRNKKVKVVEKVKILEIVNKCPSLPSLFFIGGDGDDDDEEEEEDNVVDKAAEEEDVVGGDLSGQELFTKAEMFIGNFYKQLKIQRKDSYKKIHGF